MSNKTLQQRLEEAKQNSPLNDLTPHQAAVRVSNSLKKDVPTGKVTKGAFKSGQEAWNKGLEVGKDTWGKTRKEKAKEMSEEEKRAYFGVKDQHSKKTKKKMSASATERWAKQMKPVMCEGKKYASIYAAGEALCIHKDTVSYRIKTRPKEYFYIK
jgi:hypothetical protein